MTPALEVREITKVYGSLVANDRVSLRVNKGEIHAIVGENGAGKSTLMKILFGLEKANSGTILLAGRPVDISSPAHAMSLGLGMVHQHFKLVESLTVAENLVLGHEPRTRMGFFSMKTAIESVVQTSKHYGLTIDPTRKIRALSVGQRQTVEILKVLYRGSKIMLLDEPTSILTPLEVSALFDTLRQLVAAGTTIILVTHRLREVFAISDRVTVMRRGKIVGTFPTLEVTPEQVSSMMVGRQLAGRTQRPQREAGPAVLRVDNLSCYDDRGVKALNSVSFQVHRGEVLGVAGVSGNGQTELVEVLSGLRSPSAGTIVCKGARYPQDDPRAIRRVGVGLIPEDRLKTGLAVPARIEENLILNNYYHSPLSRLGLLQTKRISEQCNKLIERFDVRTSSGKMPAASLSGGNQQKVVLAREMSECPELLILHEPTWGLDVGAIEFVHAEIARQVEGGAGALVVSTDLDEIMQLSDRVIVLYRGEVVAEFADLSQVSEVEIGHYMLGLKRQGE